MKESRAKPKPNFNEVVSNLLEEREMTQADLLRMVHELLPFGVQMSREPISRGLTTNTWSLRYFDFICQALGLQCTHENVKEKYFIDNFTGKAPLPSGSISIDVRLGRMRRLMSEMRDTYLPLARMAGDVFDSFAADSYWIGSTISLFPQLFQLEKHNEMILRMFSAIRRGALVCFFTPTEEFIERLDVQQQVDRLEEHDHFCTDFELVFRTVFVDWLLKQGHSTKQAREMAERRVNRFDAEEFTLIGLRECLSLAGRCGEDGEITQELFYRGFKNPLGLDAISPLPHDNLSIDRFNKWVHVTLKPIRKKLKEAKNNLGGRNEAEQSSVSNQLEFIERLRDRMESRLFD